MFQTLNDLKRLLFAGAKTDAEQALAGSITYSYTVESIYKLSVRDCYVWERLGTNQQVDTKKVLGMDIMNIYDYFKNGNRDMIMFEGYENTVRNAVSHATFFYDPKDGITTYTDKRKGLSVKHTLLQIEDKYEKLRELYLYVMLRNVLINVGDACTRLLNREWKP
jgi:hypothetical protein